METDHPRDFVGYGAAPPDPKWPGGASLAVQFVINYEEGSEYSMPDGDGFSETAGGELAGVDFGPGKRNLAQESFYEYGSRAGIWRLLRQFDRAGVPATVFGCALALERNPEVAGAIAGMGYDVCCHGWRWVEHFNLPEDEERDHIRRAVASIEASMGARPLGWYCRYGPSVNTRRLIVEEGGFLYDSDAYNDDLPYWVTVSGKPHLVIPYALDTNDSKFGSGDFGTGGDFFHYLKDSFDVLRQEGRERARMMSIGLHARIAGRPGRAAGLARFLDYLNGHDDIWICRRLDIARHWIEHHPSA